LAGFCNLGYVSLWGIKVTVSEIWRDEFISNRSRLAAEGVGRYQRVNVQKAGYSRVCNATQSPQRKYRCFCASLFDEAIAEIAPWALRLIIFLRKRPPTRRVGGFQGILVMLHCGE